MDGKTVIITGGSSGIGSETAKELAKLNARIILAGIDLDGANKVKGRNTNTHWLDYITQMFTNYNINSVLKQKSTCTKKKKYLIRVWITEEIIGSTSNQSILVKHLDLASQKSVREFAADILETEKRLDVLIHNAGSAEITNRFTEDGLEINMAINHFGPFLLTHLLIGGCLWC